MPGSAESWAGAVVTKEALRPQGRGLGRPELVLSCARCPQLMPPERLGPWEQLFPTGGAQAWAVGSRAGSSGRIRGLSLHSGSPLGAKQLSPRPPESPGSFPVTAGSAARAIYNSHSRLCSAVALPGEPGEGQPTAGSLGPGYEALT